MLEQSLNCIRECIIYFFLNVLNVICKYLIENARNFELKNFQSCRDKWMRVICYADFYTQAIQSCTSDRPCEEHHFRCIQNGSEGRQSGDAHKGIYAV